MLSYSKFIDNDRILNASRNSPPLKPGDQDSSAVRILQEALIKTGFNIPDGATGYFGNQTTLAVQALERKFQLSVDDGVAGREVFQQLDDLLSGRAAPLMTFPSVLSLVIQAGFNTRTDLRPYINMANELLKPFDALLRVIDARNPKLDYRDPFDESPIETLSLRELAEKHTVERHFALRVIDLPFKSPKSYGITSGGKFLLADGSRVRDFVIINAAKRRHDNTTLLHEMIHATGIVGHDKNDPASVFAEVDSDRTILRPQHAEALKSSFFSRTPQ